ncbi:retropepsin-like aspartic protease family protein [Maricaulis sp.]|uniref:retropepsin-like aspartic protease family protein n=1 Tax=Maricaulis sp. TaxID=1486257 RepID=UPI002B26FE37|nr:TIGR02281 family clan AA aspartic protease [Maricaulis sp.]
MSGTLVRQIATRIAVPALALGIALLGLRLVSWPLWADIAPLIKTIFIGTVLALLGLALAGSALSPDGRRHRNLVAWLSIGIAAVAINILNRDYADWQYQELWGAAPAAPGSSTSSGLGVQLSDGAIVLERQFDGHFYINSEINGAEITFMIDTGATGVALSLADARHIGIRTDQLDYTIRTSTAAGLSMAAPVEIRSLTLPGRSFDSVPALVMNGGDQSLLGMTVLERFESIEIRRDQLILRSN